MDECEDNASADATNGQAAKQLADNPSEYVEIVGAQAKRISTYLTSWGHKGTTGLPVGFHCMEYRIDKQGLLDRVSAWDSFLKKKVHLIACGGTSLTLLGLKASTKDIDLIVPDLDEYDYLISILKDLGYKSASGWGWKREDGFIFDLFRGKSIHTTQLLESPLDKGNNILIKEFNRIYLGVLNYYDIIISKLFRATAQDLEDCLILIKSKKKDINLKRLEKRFRETVSFDVSQDKVNKNFENFLKILKKEGLTDER